MKIIVLYRWKQELIVWQLEYLSNLMLGVRRRGRTCSYVTRKATKCHQNVSSSTQCVSSFWSFLVVSFQATSSARCILLLSSSQCPQTSPLLSPHRAFAKVRASIGTIR